MRRYGNLETALRLATGDLRAARRFQRSLNDATGGVEAATAQQPVLVVSRQPSAYLRIPAFGRSGSSGEMRELKRAEGISYSSWPRPFYRGKYGLNSIFLGHASGADIGRNLLKNENQSSMD